MYKALFIGFVFLFIAGSGSAEQLRWTDKWDDFHQYDPKAYELKKDEASGYGESFFMQAYTPQGDMLYLLMSVTNYHPFKDYMQSIDFYWVNPQGEVVFIHEDYNKDELQESVPGGGIRMGPNLVNYHHRGGEVKLDANGVKVNIQFTNKVRPTNYPGGSLTFEDNLYWGVFINSPWMEMTATIETKGKTSSLQAQGYADHGRASKMVPDFSKEWHRIRFFDTKEDLSISFFRIDLEDEYGPEPLVSAVVLKEDEVLGISGTANLLPEKRKKNPKSGYMVPRGYSFAVSGPRFELEGEVDQFVHRLDIDLLGVLPWATRTVVKTFFANPWYHYFSGTIHIRGTIDGKEVNFSGPAMVAPEFYD